MNIKLRILGSVLILSVIGLSLLLIPPLLHKKPREIATNEIAIVYPCVSVKVIRHGKIVQSVTKKGDMLTLNFIALIWNIMFGAHYEGGELTIKDKDGGAHNYIDTQHAGTNPSLAIGIGTSSVNPSLLDYCLGAEYKLGDVDANHVSITDNGTCFILTATKEFVADSEVTIYEVGLFLKVNWGYTLLARDVLPEGVHLLANDTISVSYKLYFRYDKPPFTKNFYAILLDYFFGLVAYGKAINFVTKDGISTTGMDTGLECSDGYRSYDELHESFRVAFGSGSLGWSPTREDLLHQELDLIPPYSRKLSYNATHVFIEIIVTQSFNYAVTINELGFFFQTDINKGGGKNAKWIMFAYFTFPDTHVPEGGAIRFYCKIIIPLSPK